MTQRKNLRRAGASDAARLGAFGARVFVEVYERMMDRRDLLAYVAEAFAEAKLRDELSDPDQIFLLAESAGPSPELQGFCKLWLNAGHPCVRTAKPAKFERSYVEPRFQRQGIGRSFFEARRVLAREAGCTGAWLSVWDRNAAAIAFHRRMGFEVVGEEGFQVGSDLQRDLVVYRDLSAQGP